MNFILTLLLLGSNGWAAVKPAPDSAFEEVINDELELEDSAAPVDKIDTVKSPESVDQPPQEPPFTNAQPTPSENLQTAESPDVQPLENDPLQTENLQKEAPDSLQTESSETLQTSPEPDVMQTEVEPLPKPESSEPSLNAQTPESLGELPEEVDPTKTRYIPHPQAEKGLMKISNKGEYYYRVKSSPQKRAGGFNIGNLSTPKIKNPNDDDANFKNLYGGGGTLTLLVSYEYQFFQALGKLAVKGGTGVGFAQGHGRLKIGNEVSREKFSFLMMPNNLSLVYRLQLFDKQPVIPYAEVGGDYFTFIEMRNDDKPNKYGGALASHVAIGGALSLNWLDRQNASRVDQEYGINAIYLTGEYRHFIGAHAQFDFSSDLISGGFLFEF